MEEEEKEETTRIPFLFAHSNLPKEGLLLSYCCKKKYEATGEKKVCYSNAARRGQAKVCYLGTGYCVGTLLVQYGMVGMVRYTSYTEIASKSFFSNFISIHGLGRYAQVQVGTYLGMGQYASKQGGMPWYGRYGVCLKIGWYALVWAVRSLYRLKVGFHTGFLLVRYGTANHGQYGRPCCCQKRPEAVGEQVGDGEGCNRPSPKFDLLSSPFSLSKEATQLFDGCYACFSFKQGMPFWHLIALTSHMPLCLFCACLKWLHLGQSEALRALSPAPLLLKFCYIRLEKPTIIFREI